MVPWLAGRGLGNLWQNVSKISPLFCGKIFEIFCHGLPAGGGQLFRTSTIFLPLLTPTFRQTPVNDSRRCVKFCCFRKSNSSMLCNRVSARSFADKLSVVHSHSRMRAVAVDFAAAAACPFGPSGPSGPPCKVFRDQNLRLSF